MKDKILTALRAAIDKNSSINDKTLNAYVAIIADKITDESQISEAIKPYVEVLKEFQGNINSVAAAAVTAKESEAKAAKEKAEAEAAAQKAAEEAAKTGGGEPEWFKSFREQQEKRISAIESEKTSTTRRRRLEEITKDSGSMGGKILKDFGRMTFESDESFEAYIEETKNDIETAKQDESNLALSGQTRPGGGKGLPSKEASQEECDAIAKRIIS